MYNFFIFIFSDETSLSHKKSTSIVVPVSSSFSPVTVLPEVKQNGEAVMNSTESDDVLIFVNKKEKSRSSQVVYLFSYLILKNILYKIYNSVSI